MSNARLAALPIDHIEAELIAFPIGSEAALRNCTLGLDPSLRTTGRTGDLWRAAENELIGAWPAVGLDEGVAIRDRLWFSGPDGNSDPEKIIPLGTYLKRVAGRALEVRGPSARPRIQLENSETTHGNIGDSRARSAWRWLSFALPSDLLLAALAKEGNIPHAVVLLDPTLGQLLSDRGFAESHLHVGAALDFPQLWVATLRILGQLDFNSDSFHSAGACFEEGRSLGAWLMRAALSRYILAEFLHSGIPSLRDFFKQYEESLLGVLGAARSSALATAIAEVRLGQLFSPDPRTGYATLRGIYRQLVGWQARLPNRPQELWGADPIAGLTSWAASRGTTPEMGYIAAALSYLEKQPKDLFFAELFWQTNRIRCLYFRHVVLRPLTPGLQWFLRAFNRMRPGRKLIGYRLAVANALHLGEHKNGLRSLEVRTSPERTFSELASLVAAVSQPDQPKETSSPLLREFRRKSDLASPPNTTTLPQIGLVLHFARVRGGSWDRGQPAAFWSRSTADPESGKNAGFRYAHEYRKLRLLARLLARFLVAFPASLSVIRGLDLCSDEVAMPTWVLAPLLRHVHDAGWEASRILKSCFGKDVDTLRTTVHVGEDFIHLMSGLRNIDQAIERYKLQRGDRLGHALALGIDPGPWARRAGRIAMPREDRLWDLLWEWRWWQTYGGRGFAGGRHVAIEHQIGMHAEAIFGEKCQVDDLLRFENLLHDEFQLKTLGFPNKGRSFEFPPGSGKLAWRFLTSPAVFSRGRQIIRVNPLEEIEALSLLQHNLKEKAGQKGLVIEVNPSSNLLVGHLGEMGSHPLWRLRPPKPSPESPELSICIGSDDPLTFATRLPEEFQHLHDALILSEHSESTALAWLDAVRQTGLDSRFTLPREADLKIQSWPIGMSHPIDLPP